MKLTKPIRKLHEQALALLDAGNLTPDEREFCYRNIRPDATTDIGKGSAFFTPWEIASDFQIETLNVNGRPKRVIDLCAGFGILSYMQHRRHWGEEGSPEITCVEINPEYVAIGEKLFPEARWIRADVFDLLEMDLEQFDEFFANPPFGPVPAEHRKRYPHGRFEYAVAEIGMRLAETGTMIVQSGITDWRLSGQRGFSQVANPKYDAWKQSRGIVFEPNCGIDCTHTPFAETGTVVEIANVERAEEYESPPEPESAFELARPVPAVKRPRFDGAPKAKQATLFDSGTEDLPGQMLLFNTDPGNANDQTTMEAKAKAGLF